MGKRRLDDAIWEYRGLGRQLSIPLVSRSSEDRFSLDIHRSRLTLFKKWSYQNRFRGQRSPILARLDFGGSTHQNPDGQKPGRDHLHLYCEGYEDRWVYEIPIEKFPNVQNRWSPLYDFIRFCNIVEPPYLERGL